MELLSECVLEPKFDDEEIEEQAEAASIELEQYYTKPDVLLREVEKSINLFFTYVFQLMVSTGFSGESVGITSPAAWSNIPNLTADHLHNFVKENFVASAMTLSGASVGHERFLGYATQFYVCLSLLQKLLLRIVNFCKFCYLREFGIGPKF